MNKREYFPQHSTQKRDVVLWKKNIYKHFGRIDFQFTVQFIYIRIICLHGIKYGKALYA